MAERISTQPWKRVLLFCDNAGADMMGMLLLARQLVHLCGEDTKVMLVANSTPALNDITYAELDQYLEAAAGSDAVLAEMVAKGQVQCSESGQTSTLLDLARIGPELNDWVTKEMIQVEDPSDWLLVLDGMGRSLESNWNAATYMLPGVTVLTCAMIKSEVNAQRLDADVYDCIVRMVVAETS
ncbi:hypothetical protein CYMTET_33692 [Cymbomonas tetramitiformis]|uniref:Damage-control phosphatase ARMT1-like metal-binding domain-containing protein n=1 Tax=Cymbomonas tetramitiformis TaxID=36881 RepID=A0AAE0FCK2_9CHLO|nr:hypothetical protein CYMTET_33692 [Cymbomonas tetramitiformis]